jgi:quinol monooxygenase YgiN
MNYYVYYKVKPEQAQEVRRAVQGIFRAIEKHCGVRGRLMRRRDDPATYMEIYEEVADESAFEALLEREGAALGLQRHLERFVSV